MADEETRVAESSSVDVDQAIAGMTSAQRQEWLEKGTLPEPPKTEESAPSKTPEKAASEPAKAGEKTPESEPGKEAQERKPSGAEKRIKQLLARNKELEERLAASQRVPEEKKEPAAPAAKQTDDPEPSLEEFSKQGKTYEEWVKAQAKWEGRQEARRVIEADHLAQAQATQKKAFDEKVAEGRKRYPDFDQVVLPVAHSIQTDEQISPVIKAIMGDSPVLVDLLYVLGSNQADLADFLETARTNPSGAIRKAVLLERLVTEELQKKPPEPPKAPEKKITAAPNPPSEVGGKGTAPEDEEAAAITRGDFRSFAHRANAREISLKKGK